MVSHAKNILRSKLIKIIRTILELIKNNPILCLNFTLFLEKTQTYITKSQYKSINFCFMKGYLGLNLNLYFVLYKSVANIFIFFIYFI